MMKIAREEKNLPEKKLEFITEEKNAQEKKYNFFMSKIKQKYLKNLLSHREKQNSTRKKI